MLPIYIIAIIIVALAACFAFFLWITKTNQKHKKVLSELLSQTPKEPEVKQDEIPKERIEKELENFSLKVEEEVKGPKLNPFDIKDSKSEENDDDDFLMDEKFNEYEEFLRQHAKDFDNDEFDETDEFDEVDDTADELNNFDFNQIKGKNDEEIADILKNLSPKAQEIILSEILARRKYDEE